MVSYRPFAFLLLRSPAAGNILELSLAQKNALRSSLFCLNCTCGPRSIFISSFGIFVHSLFLTISFIYAVFKVHDCLSFACHAALLLKAPYSRTKSTLRASPLRTPCLTCKIRRNPVTWIFHCDLLAFIKSQPEHYI